MGLECEVSYTVKDVDNAIEGGFTYSWELRGWHEEETRGWHGLCEALFWCDRSQLHLPDIGVVTGVEDHGGGEGSGEERWFVFKITDEFGGERLFRRNGYYASFHGSDFDGPTEEVVPAQKMITVFEAVK